MITKLALIYMLINSTKYCFLEPEATIAKELFKLKHQLIVPVFIPTK